MPGVADRFLENVEKSFEMMFVQSRRGAHLKLKDARLKGMRKWSVSGLESYLIFSSTDQWNCYRSRAA